MLRGNRPIPLSTNLVPRTGVLGVDEFGCRVSGRAGPAMATHPGAGWRKKHRMNAKITLGLSELTPEQKVTFTEERITSLNSNAATFPAPNPSVAVLTTAKNNLDIRLKAIAQMESLLDAERSYALTEEAELDVLLQQEANYVENIAKGEASVILLSGFPLAQEPMPVGQLAPPQNLLGIATDIEGQTKLKWNSVHGAKSYIVECANNPNGPWSQVTVTTRISCLATNLTPGTKYWFRVRAVGAAGLSGWSDPAAKLAA